MEKKINRSKLRFRNEAIQTKKLSENAKYVLLCLQWHDKMINKNKYDDLIISYKFMFLRFGINSTIYNDSLDELKKQKFIKISKGKSRNGNVINFIKLIKPQNPNIDYELFENVYATTPVYTPKQKIFIGLFYYILDQKDNKGYGETALSLYAIKKAMLELGVSESTTKDRLDELTYDITPNGDEKYKKRKKQKKKEYVPLFTKDEKGYWVEKDVLTALYKLDHQLHNAAGAEYERAKVTGSTDLDNMVQYHVYKKADCHKYWYDEETKRIYKED